MHLHSMRSLQAQAQLQRRIYCLVGRDSIVLSRSRKCCTITSSTSSTTNTTISSSSSSTSKGRQPRLRSPSGTNAWAGAPQAKRLELTSTEALDLITQQRLALLERAPHQVFKIKGVTFEGRQDVVAHLMPGQPLLFLKDPSNPYDSHAVEIRTLEGVKLGYVARHLTAAFPLQVSFGQVAHVGCEPNSSNWGALASCSPALHFLCLDLLPPNWPGQHLHQVFGEQQWQQLQQQVLKKYSHRCAISTVPADRLPLQVVPQWGFDYHAKRVWLTGLIPLCEQLVQYRQELLQQAAAKAQQQEQQQQEEEAAGGSSAVTSAASNTKLFAELMGWRDIHGTASGQEELVAPSASAEVEKYLRHVVQQQQQVVEEGWELVTPQFEDCVRELVQVDG